MPSHSESEVHVLEPGERNCGEGCGRSAAITVEGDYAYCGTCLKHLLLVAGIFKDATDEADDHLQALR